MNDIEERKAYYQRIGQHNMTPLSEVLAQFNRRNRVRLVLGDATLAARPVSGNIRVDNAETFAGLLESGGDIVADRSEPGVIVLRKAR